MTGWVSRGDWLECVGALVQLLSGWFVELFG